MNPRTIDFYHNAADPGDVDDASDRRLERAVSALYADAVPSEAFRTRVRALAAGAAKVKASPPPRRKGVLIMSGATVAAGCAVICAAALFMTPGAPVYTTPAFATVEAAMSSIRYAHWTETSDGFRPLLRGSDDVWLRLDPPAISDSRTFPPGQRRGIPAARLRATRWVVNANLVRDYNGVKNTFLKTKIKTSPTELRQQLLSRVLMPNNAVLNDNSTRRTGPGYPYIGGAGWRTSRITLNGRPTLLIENQAEDPWNKTKKGTTVRVSTVQIRIWADPKTRRVVRREMTISQPGSTRPAFQTIATNFRYDEEPPPGIFEVTPPPTVPENAKS